MLRYLRAWLAAVCLCAGLLLGGCSGFDAGQSSLSAAADEPLVAHDVMADPADADDASASADEEASRSAEAEEDAASDAGEEDTAPDADEASDGAEPSAPLNLAEDYRASFVHGEKPAEYQKYIVLHDTEGGGDAYGVIDSWDATGAGVAAHFVVNKDGSIVQCVPLDKIAHHAGFGDAGHNDLYGIAEDGRDDLVGTVPIGDWAPDYGMNAWSVGIELVHIGGEGPYPEEQLEALDGLIAHIDAHFGTESTIIDHKAWRSGNSDTSPEFAEYLANYQDHRTHA